MKRALHHAALLALICCAVAPAAWADPPSWAPAHGWRAKHHYTYYPRGEVYYAPATRTWFWLDGGNWRSGIRLPLDFQAYIHTGGISIELGSDRPYVEHSYVVEHYGGEPPREYRRRGHEDRGEGGHGNQGHGHDKHGEDGEG